MTNISITDDSWKVIIDNINIKDLSLEVKKILIDMLSLKTVTQKEYKGAWFFNTKKYINTWIKRCPLKWEMYLSWAKPEAYKAFHNLDQEFYIAKEL